MIFIEVKISNLICHKQIGEGLNNLDERGHKNSKKLVPLTNVL